jgi:hypothetical protein
MAMRWLHLLCAAAAAACSAHEAGRPPPDAGMADDATTGVPSPLTYWDDIAPILEKKCLGCHQEGGIAPFRLDGYQELTRVALSAAAVTRAGIMPPYLVTHDGTCGQFEDHETLSAEDRAAIWEWAHADQKQGTPAVLRTPPRPSLGAAREWRTPILAPVAAGGELAELDEYRCFPFDSNLQRSAFITAYEVLPGTPALVHHVVAYLVNPARVTESGKTNAEVMAALDRADPDRPGWPCFSLAGPGVEIEAVPVIWAPGQGPVIYPDGIGVQHQGADTLVIQMHYNLADSRVQGMSDSTTVRLRHADTVKRRGVFLLRDGFVDTLSQNPPASLPPGRKSVKFTWSRTGEQMGLDRVPHVDLLGVMPHMHERGVRQQMSIGPIGGEKACAARVDRWDFHWQKFYFYEGTPIRMTAASELELSCEYDTSLDRAPVLPGWGTRNEMCIAILMFALPPGF